MYTPEEKQEIKEAYQAALDQLQEKLEQDKYVLALFVGGSFSYDEVWEYSDIDVTIVLRDDADPAPNTLPWGALDLIEYGIHFDGHLIRRKELRKMLEGGLQGNLMHSSFSKSRLVFSKDKQINEYYERIKEMGERDRQVQMLRSYDTVYKVMEKTKKWLLVKQDLVSSYWWYMLLVQMVARMEIFNHGQIPLREMLKQVMELNPEFFDKIYTRIISEKLDKALLEEGIELIDEYLREKTKEVYEPVLKYLEKEKGMRSQSEIAFEFKTKGVYPICQPLVNEGLVMMESAPIKLTGKSTVFMDEPAYYLLE